MHSEQIQVGKTYIGKARNCIPRTVMAIASGQEFEVEGPESHLPHVLYTHGGKTARVLPLKRFAKWTRQEIDVDDCRFCPRTKPKAHRACHVCAPTLRQDIAIDVTDSITVYR